MNNIICISSSLSCSLVGEPAVVVGPAVVVPILLAIGTIADGELKMAQLRRRLLSKGYLGVKTVGAGLAAAECGRHVPVGGPLVGGHAQGNAFLESRIEHLNRQVHQRKGNHQSFQMDARFAEFSH